MIESEVAAIKQVKPEIIEQLELAEAELKSENERIKELEVQIRALIQQNETLAQVDDAVQARSICLGRVVQFLETSSEDAATPKVNLDQLRNEIEELQQLVDPQAIRDRVQDAENMVSNYSTEMLTELPSTAPLTGARLQFLSEGRLKIIEQARQRSLNLVEVCSDQNYLAIHLALLFSLHKHFETVRSPVPGLLVIDQVSRPYYPKDQSAEDEKGLEEMSTDEDRRSMRRIIDFIFNETAKSSGLQILLIEHAYIKQDPRFVAATKERWTVENGQKLIPEDWPERT